MDTLLENGRHKLDSKGSPVLVDGYQELMQRAMIRLIVARGSLQYDPTFGSRLRSIRTTGSTQARNAQALAFAREALLPMKNLSVQDVQCSWSREQQRLAVALVLSAAGKQAKVEVSV